MEIDKDVKTIQTTKQKIEDDSEEEATSDSSKPIDDTSDDEIPKEVVGNRNSDKHDASRRPGGETCKKKRIKGSNLAPHRHPALDIKNENGEKLEIETEGGGDTVIIQPAKDNNCNSSDMKHVSGPGTVSIVSMDIDPKEGTE